MQSSVSACQVEICRVTVRLQVSSMVYASETNTRFAHVAFSFLTTFSQAIATYQHKDIQFSHFLIQKVICKGLLRIWELLISGQAK